MDGFNQIIGWLTENREWVFSGIGLVFLGVISWLFGWIKKIVTLLKNFLRGSSEHPALFEIPNKTLILQQEARPDALWWHMGKSRDQAAMQIVGDLKATSICKYNVLVTSAKLRKPKAMGFVTVRKANSDMHGEYMIKAGTVTDLHFSFWVMPPVLEEGKTLKADIAIIDQFGNEHWLKKLEFKYA